MLVDCDKRVYNLCGVCTVLCYVRIFIVCGKLSVTTAVKSQQTSSSRHQMIGLSRCKQTEHD